MDRIYRSQRHIYDLTRKYYLLGRDRLLADLDLAEGGTVLEVGCGTGRNLIRAARLWPDARLFGIDISAEMLATARAKVNAAGLSDRISLAQADAAAFDPVELFGRPHFDRVIFSYTLSMIPPWREALGQGVAVTAPAGRLAIVDFDTQAGLPRLWQRAFTEWLRRFDVTPRADLADQAVIAAERAGRHASTTRLWRGYARRATIT